MSAVVSAVKSVFNAVGDAVGDIVEGVGNLVENIVDEVVEPVVKAVGKTIEAAMDDPLGTIAKIGVAIYAPSLLPAFNFGYAVATGVPLEKALINTGLNMIGAEIGTSLGNTLTCTFDLSCAASNVVTAGAKGAVASTLKGQNALCGAVGAMANNLINTGAKDLVNGVSNSLSSTGGGDCTPSGGLPVTIGGAADDCTVGCASTTNLGALPGGTTTQIGENTDNTVNVTGSRDSCTDVVCTSGGLTRGLGTTGSAATTDTGATTGTGALDTVTVTGAKPTCTDLTCTSTSTVTGGLPTCTFDPNAPATGNLGTVVVTGKKDACEVTCAGTVDVNGTKDTSTTPTLPTVTVTGTKDACEVDCTSVPTLPTVTVTAKREACDVTCVCDCDDETPVVKPPIVKPPKIKIPKIKIPNIKPVQTVGTLGTLGCGAIPWLDTRDSMLRNQIVFDKSNPEIANQAKLQDMYGRMDSCLAKEMQDRYGGVPQINLTPFGEPTGGLAHGGSFAGGGEVASCSMTYCYNNDAKYMPKFVNCGSDMLVNSATSKRQPLTLKQLAHLQQRISQHGNMGGLAAGGLPKKYKDAMPDDHNPEFVTGMTGYYACGGGTGQSDDIPAMLHDGDYVMDADVVAALGDGSSKAGREVLEGFRSQIRHDETSKGKPVPAKIADGEYVFPAGFVSALGGGDNKAGAKILDGLREKLRAHKRSAPTSKIPPKAKSPLDYIKQTKG
jgi:hypothetical protein